MANPAKIFFCILISSLAGGCSSVGAQDSGTDGPDIVSTVSNGKTYYHVLVELSSTDIVSVDELTREEFERNGGQFEVLMRQSGFPVDAPNCDSEIILRMPWTVPGKSSTQPSIAEKYEVYRDIVAAHSSDVETSVDVVIELNPYIKNGDSDVTLAGCNVFFRHAKNQYVPYVGPLRSYETDEKM